MLENNKKLERLYKVLGKDYVLKKASEISESEIVRTEVFGLDYVLDGGIRLCEGGHKIEFFGDESSGKSTFCLFIIKKYQKLGKSVVYIDTEHSYDKSWAKHLGVDNEKLLILTPRNLEEIGDILPKLIPEVDLIIIDSIVAQLAKEQIDRGTDEPTMALQARVNSIICGKVYEAIEDKKTTIIFVNQVREKVGVMFGNPETTSGGHALRHLYNTRIKFKRSKGIDKGTGREKERIGNEIILNCIKNKRGKPHRKTCIKFYDTGKINQKESILFKGIQFGVVDIRKNTYIFKNKKGTKNKFLEKLTPKDWKEIEEGIWNKLNPKGRS